MASLQSAIKIFARLKPFHPTVESTPYDINLTAKMDEEVLTLSCSRSAFDYVNNKPEQYNFRYARVFDTTAEQAQIFDEVARPVIDSALLGYNGTIFAYGQTGSGKTFTMTGSREHYEDRGILPRSLQYVFEKFTEAEEQGSSKLHSVFISYLEIYNETGYDLLFSDHMNGSLDDMPKVTILEDGNQQMHLKNLSVHPIASVAEATQLLYVGDHNRTIAETPLNEVSTRSHCIFTIHINIRDAHSSLATRSKIHLVDLAGSERVANTCVSGHLLNEARHINLALHYLEQVIVALGDTNRQHIPYRNSMMTSLLRDSLGGNCLTAMIATLSMEGRNVQETLSTNRFAQRVALVTNAAIRNEELDPNVLILQLKSEIKKYKEIISSSAVKQISGTPTPLSDDEQQLCKSLVEQFLHDSDDDAILPIKPDMRLIQECFRLLRSSAGRSPLGIGSLYNSSRSKTSDNAVINDLHRRIKRREAEIEIIMGMLRKARDKNQIMPSNSEYNFLENVTSSIETSQKNNNCAKTSSGSKFSVDEEQEGLALGENGFEEIKRSPNIKKPKKNESKALPLESKGSQVDPNGNIVSTFTTEEQNLLIGLNGVKKEAMTTFMKTYAGAKDLNAARTNLMQKKKEMLALEATVKSQYKNMEGLKGLVSSAVAPNRINEAFESQERTCEMQRDRLEKSQEHVAELETTLKTQFGRLLDNFEAWWKENQLNYSHGNPTSDSTLRDKSSSKNVSLLSIGIESQVGTKDPYTLKNVEGRNNLADEIDNQKSMPDVERQVSNMKMTSRGDTAVIKEKSSRKQVGRTKMLQSNEHSPIENIFSSRSKTNLKLNTESLGSSPSRLSRLINPDLDLLLNSGVVESSSEKISPPKASSPAFNYHVPNKELFYTPGEIRPAPKAPPVSPINMIPRKVAARGEENVENVKEDSDWMKNIPKTGHPETDKNILDFFKTRREYAIKKSQAKTNLK